MTVEARADIVSQRTSPTPHITFPIKRTGEKGIPIATVDQMDESKLEGVVSMTRRESASITRRRFLQLGSASTIGMCVIPTLAEASGHAELTTPFSIGVQSYCFRNFNLEHALKRTHDLGLKHIEFYRGHVPVASTPEQIKAVLKLCGEYDVKPVAFGVEGFSKDHAANQKVFDFAKALGVKYLSADPTRDSFDSLDKLVAEYDIAIAIHPHGPGGDGKLHRWYSAEVIMDAVKSHHPLIGACLDTGHLIRADQLGKKLDPAQQVRVMGERNFGMHLKDHDNRTKTDVIYGKGALDVPAVLKALHEVKFRGYISIEYEANPDDPSPDMKACLDVLTAALKAQS
jgi:sugar phosphate isomerase/epimerase